MLLKMVELFDFVLVSFMQVFFNVESLGYLDFA